MVKIKKLRLPDLILDRRGSLVFKIILAIFGIALKLFFRRIETVNADSVPKGTGVIFVLNHPNGLIDPAMVFVALPRRISFLAKSTLFRMPVIAFLLRTVEALPLYRRIDHGEDISKNTETFEAAEKLLRSGGSIALFPEGVSHSSPKLLPIKTGTARIALGAAEAAAESGSEIDIRIVPVGLFYTSKTTFRSEALLHFGESFRVDVMSADADGLPQRAAVRALTHKIEISLREVTLNAESDADLRLASAAERIFAAGSGANEFLGEKFDFQKEYSARIQVHPDDLASEVERHQIELGLLKLEPRHLLLARLTQRFVMGRALIILLPMVAVFPFAFFGAILHFPAYEICRLAAALYARHDADDVKSTAKVLAGIVFFPFTWIVTAVIVYFFAGWEFALASIPFAVICGYLALFSVEQFSELRGWARAIWIFFTKREKFLRLYVEQKELTKALREFD